jgi:hypothetical protein
VKDDQSNSGDRGAVYRRANQHATELPYARGVANDATIYTCERYRRLEVNEAHRLERLESENQRFRHLVADLSLEGDRAKNGWGFLASEAMWRSPGSAVFRV